MHLEKTSVMRFFWHGYTKHHRITNQIQTSGECLYPPDKSNFEFKTCHKQSFDNGLLSNYEKDPLVLFLAMHFTYKNNSAKKQKRNCCSSLTGLKQKSTTKQKREKAEQKWSFLPDQLNFDLFWNLSTKPWNNVHMCNCFPLYH